MSREAARTRALSIAAALAQLPPADGDGELMGYPILMLCQPMQRAPLPVDGSRASLPASGGAAAARTPTPLKEP